MRSRKAVDDRRADGLVAVLQVERSEAGLDERRQDVAVRGEPG